ncbi:hypothetical protein QBC47DRAFT_272384, partial [Echria macrotheca]
LPQLFAEEQPQITHRRSVSVQANIPIGAMEDNGDTDPVVGGHQDALVPLGLSFRGQDGSLRRQNISVHENFLVRQYLRETFNAVGFDYFEPWITIICDPSPPRGRLPVSIGGLMPIWQTVDDDTFMPLIGGGGQGEEYDLEDDVVGGFQPSHVPQQAAVLAIVNRFYQDAIAITFIAHMMVVELPETDLSTFIERLQSLPSGFTGISYMVRYHNGPLPYTSRASRAVRPTPQRDDDRRVADETDYVQKDGKFYPGSMISSQTKEEGIHISASAGILVRKGDEVRLTASWHCWEQHHQKYPGILGQDTDEAKRVFGVRQGGPGTYVGHVVERVGGTDIALIKLAPGIEFENSFFDTHVVAGQFVHSANLSSNERYMIDGFPTGRQGLDGVGVRYPFKRGPRNKHPHPIEPPGTEYSFPYDEVTYIQVAQGVCGTSDPVLTSKPFIRDSVCGAVLLRGTAKSLKGEAAERIYADVVGMCHYADLTPKNAAMAQYYLMYADSFDPLIDEGWDI